MTSERPRPRYVPRTTEAFDLSYHEEGSHRVAGERFTEILDDGRTTIHEVSRDFNDYGEFLFVTLSRPLNDRPVCITLYGLGFHEHRERWITDEWSWYESYASPATLGQTISKDEARRMVDERREYVGRYATQTQQSPRARLYETLAELTDEDGALAELDDLGELADWLIDEDGEDGEAST